MNVSDYLASRLLNGVFRNTAYTFPDTVYIALYTSDPMAADTGQEVSGGAY
ncbi:phage tail fiber protein, partial [Paenibacillus ehimensis]